MVLPSGRWQFHWLGGRFFFDGNSNHQDATTCFLKGFLKLNLHLPLESWEGERHTHTHTRNLAIFDWQQTPGIWPLAAQVWIRVVGPECRRFIWCSPWSITTLMWGPPSPIFLPDFFGNCWWIRGGGKSDGLEWNFLEGLGQGILEVSLREVEGTMGSKGMIVGSWWPVLRLLNHEFRLYI